jgi:hypothetical protein
MKKCLVAIAIPAALLLFAVPLVLANPAPVPVIPSECINSQSAGWNSTPIINVTWYVTNDEDSGFVGYWALDNYRRTLVVWQNSQTPNQFCVFSQYNGTWTTFKGALSPENGVAEPQDGEGKLAGGRVAIITGTLLGHSSSKPLTGFIGYFDFGGKQKDILKGTYGNGQTGDTSPVSWPTFYFALDHDFVYTDLTWAWTYTADDGWDDWRDWGDDGVECGTMWVNAVGGSFGDIVTSTH